MDFWPNAGKNVWIWPEIMRMRSESDHEGEHDQVMIQDMMVR